MNTLVCDLRELVFSVPVGVRDRINYNYRYRRVCVTEIITTTVIGGGALKKYFGSCFAYNSNSILWSSGWPRLRLVNLRMASIKKIIDLEPWRAQVRSR